MRKLIAESVDANVEGIGSVKVYATEKLKANVHGIGSLTYYGNPKNISKSVEGIGGVSAGKISCNKAQIDCEIKMATCTNRSPFFFIFVGRD